MTVNLSRVLLASACTFALATPALAQADTNATAQDTQPADTALTQTTATDTNDTDEIIVTAQHRVENVQDVPIAISVVSGETLKDSGVTDFTSVAKVSPSLQITSDTSNTRVTVRGVGTLSNNEAQDQSIAVNIDGEYINRPQILNAAIFDMDRVEVLRGPQGTLYGKNSTGGAVNFITRKPGNRLAVNGSVTLGNYETVIAEAGVDIPLGDIGAVRFSGMLSAHEGYFKHDNPFFVRTEAFTPSSLRRSGDDYTRAGRVSLRLNPTDGLTIDAAVEHINQDIHPTAYAWVDLNDPANGPGPTCNNPGWEEVAPVTPGIQCIPSHTNFLPDVSRDTYEAPLSGVSDFHLDSTAVRGRLSYDFGAATFTYTGGYRDSTNTGDNMLSPAYDFTNFGATVKTQSHEARLNGVIGNGIQWQTGVFYFREKLNTNGGLYIPCIANRAVGCLSFLNFLFGPNGSYLNYFRHPTDSKSLSGFGQVEVPIIQDKLVAVAGGRYTSDKRDGDFTNYPFPLFHGIPCGFNPSPPSTCNTGPIEFDTPPDAETLHLHSKDHKFTWLAGLNYTPNEDLLVYGKVSTGFKAGGFDGTGTTFRPETNTAYEAGTKWSLGRGSFFNVAGFYYSYKDLQNDVLLNANLGGQTFNAGKATIWGLEADAQYKVTRNDTLTATVNYLHAKYDDFLASYNVITTNPDPDNGIPDATAPLPEDNVDLGGNWLPQAPQWVLSLGYDHVFDLGSSGTLTARAYTRYKSKYWLDFYNYNDSKQTGFHQTDLSLEWLTVDQHLSVQAFVRNLEDKRPLVYSTYIAAGNDDIYNWAFGTPRTFGARVAIKY
jgi:iron complex outermembrane receptor protein